MVLDENNYIEKINALPNERWYPLLDLIPLIEDINKFADFSESEKLLKIGIIDLNSVDEHEIVDRF